jgi:hypothetical protein
VAWDVVKKIVHGDLWGLLLLWSGCVLTQVQTTAEFQGSDTPYGVTGEGFGFFHSFFMCGGVGRGE